MLTIILLGTVLVVMFMRVVLPVGRKAEGDVLSRVSLSFRERLLLQRANIYAIGAVLLLGAIGGWISTTLELLAILMVAVILMIPAKYVLTNKGVGLNNTLFRGWREFEDYRLQGARVQLIPRGKARGLTLFVPLRAHSEVINVLKRQLQK